MLPTIKIINGYFICVITTQLHKVMNILRICRKKFCEYGPCTSNIVSVVNHSLSISAKKINFSLIRSFKGFCKNILLSYEVNLVRWNCKKTRSTNNSYFNFPQSSYIKLLWMKTTLKWEISGSQKLRIT
jgi:hypothetical protein